MMLDLVFLVGRTTSGGVFWGVCELLMILSNFSSNWQVCVLVLLVVWHRVSNTVACLLLSGAGSFSLAMEISERLFSFDITCCREVSGGTMF